MNNFKIPKIRFMNFNDKWKYKILGEISNSIEYGLNASAKDFDGIHKYLRITDIDDSSRLFLTDKLSSPDVNFTEEDYENYKLQINDLLFARTGASVGKTYLYRESDGEVYYAGFLIRARLHDSYDGNFIFQQTLTDKYKQFIEITSQRSGQPGVNGKEYGDWKIGMTSYPEQSAIGSLFRTLDDLLASYKENLANYQSLKATMLSKMFPKAGQAVPEIRLDGFEGEWKVKEFGDVVEFYSGLTYKPSDVVSSGTLVLRSSNVRDGELIYKDNVFVNPDIVNCQHVKFGDIVVVVRNGSRDLIGKHALIKSEMPNTVIGAFMTGVKSDRPEFVNALLDTKVFVSEINKNLGSTINQITTGNFKRMKFSFPTKEEQQAIGTYFSNLDNLITAHQEKISKLETLKKKLLQDMFI